MKEVVLIGYGGHGLVAADILLQTGHAIVGYCDINEKESNPYSLKYLGPEKEYFLDKPHFDYAFIAIGDTILRQRVFDFLKANDIGILSAIHPKAVISSMVKIEEGVLVAANAVINPACSIGAGAICNTSSSVDHECRIGMFAHVCPGSVLCGNVSVGSFSFVGAGSVVKPGVRIGNNVIIGAGSVVVKDILEPGTYFGNPARRKTK